MEYVEWSAETPELNLAMDEALLLQAEEGTRDESLRLWSTGDLFVVLGYSRRVATEVNVEECARAGVPILRRASGGGTVLQGPGCLNYSLVLRFPEGDPPGIIDTTRRVMEKHAALFTRLLGEEVRHEGESDLTVRGRKFSGNAQRRLHRALMFHGTFLLHADLPAVSRFLRHPEREPEYRGGRSHGEFLTNVGCTSRGVSAALAAEWSAADAHGGVPLPLAHSLCAERYSRPDWNLRR